VLGQLGFFVAGQDRSIKVAVPSWRPDVHGKADVVEEIVRIIGVDRVPSVPFDSGGKSRKPVLTSAQIRTRKAKRALAARGLVEAVTWSFVAKAQAELFGGGKPELALANPIAADLSDMRPSLIPGLVAAAQKNADRGFPDVALFEVGQVFRGDQPQDQLTAASGVRRALAKASGIGRHWSDGARAVDAFDVKADAPRAVIQELLDYACKTSPVNSPLLDAVFLFLISQLFWICENIHDGWKNKPSPNVPAARRKPQFATWTPCVNTSDPESRAVVSALYNDLYTMPAATLGPGYSLQTSEPPNRRHLRPAHPLPHGPSLLPSALHRTRSRMGVPRGRAHPTTPRRQGHRLLLRRPVHQAVPLPVVARQSHWHRPRRLR